jgi:zinc/manganese transport system permease protein
MFAYDFMRNAFAAASIVAVVAGFVGFFLVLRGQAFAGHALSHVGFAGATGAVLVGLPPLGGLVVLTILAGVAMGWLGDKMAGRDVAIGVVLSFSLGLGLLFLHFYTGYAAQATALLFGNILGVDVGTVWSLLGLSLLCLVALGIIARPLLFATVQPELAEARGVSLRRMGALFLVVVAVTTAACAEVVGVLLVFTLMVAPAATAQRITTRLWTGLALAAVIAMVAAWLGLAMAYWTDWPVSVWITAISCTAYVAAVAARRSA